MNTPIRSILIAIPFLSLAPLPNIQAVNPPPDDGYPGGNTAEGLNALFSLTTGGYNTAVGFLSLRSNATGQLNTAVGAGTLLANTADGLTAIGAGALLSNTTGASNTAAGAFALFSNTTGYSNTANGIQTLFANTEGHDNSAFGKFSLRNNTTGSFDTALGGGTLENNSIGSENVAVGSLALFSNSGGSYNTAAGVDALPNNVEGENNSAFGWHAGSNITGAANICIGAGVTGVAGENNTIRIGDNLPGGVGESACYIGGIYVQSVDVNSYATVYIDGTGKLGTLLSSLRFKRDIQPMENTSEAILALKPVTFHYKGDAKNTSCFGLIAEEVEKINPDLVVHDKSGEPLSVRYDQINAMLLNEFLKEHKRVEELRSTAAKQEATIAELRKDLQTARTRQQQEIQLLTAELKEQAAQIQKVSAQLQVNGPAPQIVAEDR
jgi:Chaperone of endosialidase